MSKVFICHCEKDDKPAVRIQESLEKEDISVSGRCNFHPNELITSETRQGVCLATKCVIIVTKNWVESPYRYFELYWTQKKQQALGGNSVIFLIYDEQLQEYGELKKFYTSQGLNYDSNNVEASIKELIDKIKATECPMEAAPSIISDNARISDYAHVYVWNYYRFLRIIIPSFVKSLEEVHKSNTGEIEKVTTFLLPIPKSGKFKGKWGDNDYNAGIKCLHTKTLFYDHRKYEYSFFKVEDKENPSQQYLVAFDIPSIVENFCVVCPSTSAACNITRCMEAVKDQLNMVTKYFRMPTRAFIYDDESENNKSYNLAQKMCEICRECENNFASDVQQRSEPEKKVSVFLSFFNDKDADVFQQIRNKLYEHERLLDINEPPPNLTLFAEANKDLALSCKKILVVTSENNHDQELITSDLYTRCMMGDCLFKFIVVQTGDLESSTIDGLVPVRRHYFPHNSSDEKVLESFFNDLLEDIMSDPVPIRSQIETGHLARPMAQTVCNGFLVKVIDEWVQKAKDFIKVNDIDCSLIEQLIVLLPKSCDAKAVYNYKNAGHIEPLKGEKVEENRDILEVGDIKMENKITIEATRGACQRNYGINLYKMKYKDHNYACGIHIPPLIRVLYEMSTTTLAVLNKPAMLMYKEGFVDHLRDIIGQSEQLRGKVVVVDFDEETEDLVSKIMRQLKDVREECDMDTT